MNTTESLDIISKIDYYRNKALDLEKEKSLTTKQPFQHTEKRKKKKKGRRSKRRKNKRPQPKFNYDKQKTWRQNYYDYIQSPIWKKRRDRVIRQHDNKCAKCQSPDLLQVHHLNYKHLFHEWKEDLTVLCKFCHEAVHSELDEEDLIEKQIGELIRKGYDRYYY